MNFSKKYYISAIMFFYWSGIYGFPTPNPTWAAL